MTGCNILAYPTYVLFGQSHKKVKAEYTGLENHSTVIFVVTNPAIDFEYPYTGLNISLATADQISRNVKNATFIDPETVDKYQREKIDWLSIPVSEIGRDFQADRVLYIDLVQFTMREEDSINLLRAHIAADIRVYEMDSESPNQHTYQTDLDILHPKMGPSLFSDTAHALIYQESISRFAEELAKKFYNHKIPVD
jgi:hypothetical protein